MTTRTLLPAIALVLAAGPLAACSGDDAEPDAATDTAALTLCRTVAVAQASLNGTRTQLSRGNVDDRLTVAYSAAIDLLTGPASDPRVPADLADLVVTLIKNLDQSRAVVIQVGASGIQTEQLSAAAVREYRAGQAVLDACAEAFPDSVPAGTPSEDEDQTE